MALVHDWLTTWGGSEQVLEATLEALGPATIHTLVYRPAAFGESIISKQAIRTSFIQGLPWATSRHRLFLPLMPLAVEQFDLREYDVILSLSHAVAHGVLPQADQLHINYVHAPMRYAWHLYHPYLQDRAVNRGPKSLIARLVLHYIRLWDFQAAQRVDHFIANSHWVAQNIRRSYRREAEVIYPPVDIDLFQPANSRDDYYVTLGRLVPYKRVDLIVEAFSRLRYPLKVIGDGPLRPRLAARAGENVEILGWQPGEVVREVLSRAKAFVYAAVEDFGISMVEALASGCPVIAFGRGGALETVTDGETGLLYREQTAEALIAAVQAFEGMKNQFPAERLRNNVVRFNKERFKAELREYVEGKWSEFNR